MSTVGYAHNSSPMANQPINNHNTKEAVMSNSDVDATLTTIVTCDGRAGCADPVSMLDQAGFVYCTRHGMWRRTHEPCRKLRPAELRKLARGEQIARY